MYRSPAKKANSRFGDWTDWAVKGGKNNLEFFAEALKVMEKDYHVGNRGLMTIGLVGSRDIPGITVRRAQSVLRWDRRPSLWSHVFLIAKAWDGKSNVARLPIREVAMFPRTGVFPFPEDNAVSSSTLGHYANELLDANVALAGVASVGDAKQPQTLSDDQVKALAARAKDPNYDRLRYDLWESLAAWQRFLWSDGQTENPLRAGVPIPASAYIEMVFEAIGLDLVPGASERNSAPEHVWNAAQWWHQEQARQERPESPFLLCGCYALRDLGASQTGHDESKRPGIVAAASKSKSKK